jgi:nicotinamidase-related amidase
MAKRLPDHSRLDLGRSVFVVIDMQNDFVRLGAPREVPDARPTIPVIARLLEAARQRAVPIIFTRFIGSPRPALIWRFNPEIATDTLFCRAGHRRRYGDRSEALEVTEVVDELTPWPGELVVDKGGYDAFHGTRLAALLKEFGADTIVLAGTVTQVCVESTARGAFHRGIWPLVVSDAVSSVDPELHRASLRVVRLSFGDVRTADEVIAAWVAATATPPGDAP